MERIEIPQASDVKFLDGNVPVQVGRIGLIQMPTAAQITIQGRQAGSLTGGLGTLVREHAG